MFLLGQRFHQRHVPPKVAEPASSHRYDVVNWPTCENAENLARWRAFQKPKYNCLSPCRDFVTSIFSREGDHPLRTHLRRALFLFTDLKSISFFHKRQNPYLVQVHAN